MYRTIVITTDVESVKVRLYIDMTVQDWIFTNLAPSVQTIMMHPQHGKDSAVLKYFEYLMGERYNAMCSVSCRGLAGGVTYFPPYV